MVTTLAKLRTAPPLFTPLPFGLLSAAEEAGTDDVHWRNGVAFTPDPCEEAGVTVMACPTDPDDIGAKTPNVDGLNSRGAEPFTVYAWVACGSTEVDQAQARVSAALTNGEGRAVERMFWTGDAGGGNVVYPHLAENAAVEDDNGLTVQTAAAALTSAAVDVVEAVGLLEDALAECYGGVGVIHVPRRALAYLAAYQEADRAGRTLYTKGGTRLAAGAGYPGTGPDGTLTTVTPTGSKRWMYATGAVKYWRSAIEVYAQPRSAIDRSNNNMVAIAERTYVIGWDCCHYAAEVNFAGVPVGTAGV